MAKEETNERLQKIDGAQNEKPKNPKAVSHPAIAVRAVSVPQRARAGMVFGSSADTIVEANTLSAEQLEAISKDPYLSATPVTEKTKK